jgi:hypothetical protein
MYVSNLRIQYAQNFILVSLLFQLLLLPIIGFAYTNEQKIAAALFNIPIDKIDSSIGANYSYNPWKNRPSSISSTACGYINGHTGIDMQTKDVAGAATADRYYYAVSPGQVISAGGDAYGTVAVYDSVEDITVLYLHSRRVLVTNNTIVKVGDILGIQGDTGSPGAEHVHLETRQNRHFVAACDSNNTINPVTTIADYLNNNNNVTTPIFSETVLKTKESSSIYALSENAFKGSLIGQCTWYAYGRVIELADKGELSSSLKTEFRNAFWDKTGRHAKNWPDFLGGNWTCTNNSVLPLEQRKKGMLAVWNFGEYGHVGFVEEISADKKTYRLSDFNRGNDLNYRSLLYKFDSADRSVNALDDKLGGVYPCFYDLALGQGGGNAGNDSSGIGDMYNDFRGISIANVQTFLENFGGSLKNINLGNTYNLDENNFYSTVTNWNLAVFRDGVFNMSPAEIIYYSAKENNINPVLLLAKIQQEQSIIAQAASQHTLNRATGYGIPNSNPSGDPAYSSFLAQLTGLTYQFDRFRQQGLSFRQAYDRYTVDNTGQDASYDRFMQIYESYAVLMDNIILGSGVRPVEPPSATSPETPPANSNISFAWHGNGSIISHHNRLLHSSERNGQDYPYGVTRDVVQLHANNTKPVGFFQWQVNTNDCQRLSLFSEDFNDSVDITIGKWNTRADDITFKNVRLPFVIGDGNTSGRFSFNDGNWLMLKVALHNNLRQNAKLHAICTSDSTTNASYVIGGGDAVVMQDGYQWAGNGSVISHIYRALSGQRNSSLGIDWPFGAFQDKLVVMPSSQKPTVFFQWQQDELCRQLVINASTNQNVTVFTKRWNEAQAQVVYQNRQLPVTLSATGNNANWQLIQVQFNSNLNQKTDVTATCQ